MSRLFTILIVAGIVVLLAVPAVAWAVGPEECYLPYVETRPSWALDVQGGVAYIGEGQCLTVVDVTSPSHPVVFGRAAPIIPHGAPASVYSYGDHVYLGTPSAGLLSVVDISDHSNPVAIKMVEAGDPFPPIDVFDMTILTPYLYLGDPTDLAILDVSDPGDPQFASAIFGTGSLNLNWWSENLYTLTDLLRVWNTPVATAPAVVATLQPATDAGSLAVTCGRAYIGHGGEFKGNRWGGLQVVNVLDPDSIHEIADYDAGESVRVFAASCQHVYAEMGGALAIFDTSDPQLPAVESLLDMTYGVSDLVVRGLYAFLVNRCGLRVIDISDRSNPLLVGAYNTCGDVNEDGMINVIDIQTVASLWDQPITFPNEQMADLDGNSTIDIADLMLAVSRWRRSP